jgi:predicted Zn-dependent protease
MGQIEAAEYTLEKLIANAPGYNDARYFLGETYGRHGKEGLAHYHLGLYYYRKIKLRNAVFHLNKALQQLDDSNKKSEVESILNKIEGEKKAQTRSDRQ